MNRLVVIGWWYRMTFYFDQPQNQNIIQRQAIGWQFHLRAILQQHKQTNLQLVTWHDVDVTDIIETNVILSYKSDAGSFQIIKSSKNELPCTTMKLVAILTVAVAVALLALAQASSEEEDVNTGRNFFTIQYE